MALFSSFKIIILSKIVKGHDSKEDACACMELMLWKIEQDLDKWLFLHNKTLNFKLWINIFFYKKKLISFFDPSNSWSLCYQELNFYFLRKILS